VAQVKIPHHAKTAYPSILFLACLGTMLSRYGIWCGMLH